MNKYQAFVKEHMAKLPASMSAKEKMSKCAEMWRNRGSDAKPKRTRARKGGILSAA